MSRPRLLLAVVVSAAVLSAGKRVDAQLWQAQQIIDKPTAGMLPDRSYMVRGQAGAESSFLVSGMVGIKQLVQIGVSYGAQNIFEPGNPAINDFPGFQIRVRIVGETERMPAIALGFDSQGLGTYHKGLERYDRKSLGFYGVASKNFSLVLGQLSLHGGLNWSTERLDDSDPNLFGAADWTLFERLAFMATIDGAFNDNGATSLGNRGVYIDAGVGWNFGEYVNAALVFRDLTENFGPMPGVSRELQITWINSF